ncbi:MAG: ABC transporter ATP-binding protein [Planctomycetes bacterium]|nr:ABC transporter ATP-binding protein [Planctomycetota bacterium]
MAAICPPLPSSSSACWSPRRATVSSSPTRDGGSATGPRETSSPSGRSPPEGRPDPSSAPTGPDCYTAARDEPAGGASFRPTRHERQVLDVAEPATPIDVHDPPRSCETLVRIRALVREYTVGPQTVRALDAIDLDLDRREFLAVVGVSGSGKSTLLQLLGALDTPTSGTISFEGRDLIGMDATLYRRRSVGFVFQSFHLIPSLTARENVALALTFQGRYGAERERLAQASLERVGLADRAGHRPSQLSGGEQQRVAIARATVHRPPLILADEPTGNLDRASAQNVLDLLEQLRTEGATIVMVTHDEAAARQHASRCVRLAGGRVESDERLR